MDFWVNQPFFDARLFCLRPGLLSLPPPPSPLSQLQTPKVNWLFTTLHTNLECSWEALISKLTYICQPTRSSEKHDAVKTLDISWTSSSSIIVDCPSCMVVQQQLDARELLSCSITQWGGWEVGKVWPAWQTLQSRTSPWICSLSNLPDTCSPLDFGTDCLGFAIRIFGAMKSSREGKCNISELLNFCAFRNEGIEQGYQISYILKPQLAISNQICPATFFFPFLCRPWEG